MPLLKLHWLLCTTPSHTLKLVPMYVARSIIVWFQLEENSLFPLSESCSHLISETSFIISEVSPSLFFFCSLESPIAQYRQPLKQVYFLGVQLLIFCPYLLSMVYVNVAGQVPGRAASSLLLCVWCLFDYTYKGDLRKDERLHMYYSEDVYST